MSLFVAWVNVIKEKADETWLTLSQREIYEQILSRWQSSAFVNLHGPPGSGKTFIARLLAKEQGYVYTHDLEDVPGGSDQVILDDAQYTRMLRLTAKELGLGRVLLISRSAVLEAMPKVNLRLDEKDVRQFLATLSNHCNIVFTETIPEGQDLAEIMRRELIKRGESDVHQRS